jgi:AraC-like DNA-binding protein
MLRPAVADYPPGAQLPTRVIDDFEFVWMLRGRARFYTDDGNAHLAPGHLLLVPPGVRHGFDWDTRRPSRHGYVHFGPDGQVPREIRLIRMSGNDPLAGLCAYLLWLGTGELDGWQDCARRALKFMLDLVHSGPLPAGRPEPELPRTLLLAVEHLRELWSNLPLRRVPVDELMSAASVSRGYLNRLFYNGFGHGAAKLLELVRCSRAETLLTRTDLSAEVIGRQCGFADLSHFSHRFTAIHGVAPSVYRAAGDAAPSVLEDAGVRRLVRMLWD